MKVDQVQQTINYTSFFNTSLTLEELHFWLISPKLHSFKVISSFVSKHPKLKKQLIIDKHPNRLKKTLLTNQKVDSLQNLISILKLLPTIKLIALTGSLSVNNSKKNDDIDLMIITSPNTLWITRPVALFIISLVATRRKPKDSNLRNKVCSNLWLDQTSLTVPKSKQNLYTAHEVLQAKPLLDKDFAYNQFISKNSWVKKHLANAYKTKYQQAGRGPTLAGALDHRVGAGPLAIRPKEGLSPKHLFLGGVRSLNLLAFKLQYFYMKSKITQEYITPNSAYFHIRDLYPKIKQHLS